MACRRELRGRASMRPRVFPAEDPIGVAILPGDDVASMRPRVFPAEDQNKAEEVLAATESLQ